MKMNVLQDAGKSLFAAAGGGKSLLSAAERGDLQQVQTILDSKPHLITHKSLYGNTALHNAAANGRFGIVKWLVRHYKQADLHQKDGNGKTPLQRAANNGHTKIVQFLQETMMSTTSTTTTNNTTTTTVPAAAAAAATTAAGPPPEPPSISSTTTTVDPPKPPPPSATTINNESDSKKPNPSEETSQQVCVAADNNKDMTMTNDLEKLRAELKAQIEAETNPIIIQNNDPQKALDQYLTTTKSDHHHHLDDRLVRFVILNEIKQQQRAGGDDTDASSTTALQQQEVEDIVQKTPLSLLKQMVLADGAKGGQYGRAIQIYNDILKESPKAAVALGGGGGDTKTVAAAAAAAAAAVVATATEQKEKKKNTNDDDGLGLPKDMVFKINGPCKESGFHTKRFGLYTVRCPLEPTTHVIKTGDKRKMKLINSSTGNSVVCQKGIHHWAWEGKDMYCFPEEGITATEISKLFPPGSIMKIELLDDRHDDDNKKNGNDSSSSSSSSGILNRLALAIALEHAVPLPQDNPPSEAGVADSHIDPVKRYLNYEMAYEAGELDPAFEMLTTWELRFVVDGSEPDETLAWGREMLRNYRPDHFLSRDYVRTVNTNIAYGSHRVKSDRNDQQQYQNILMNGGVCGRRAFFGRFLCRAFGIPTTARPSQGHGALVHWTPTKGWIVQLGPPWGKGWTKTIYKNDLDFLATTQARTNPEAFWKVKRAQWIGSVMGERPCYGLNDEHLKKHPETLQFWYDLSLKLQQEIIDELPADAQNRVPNHKQPKTVVERVLATPAPANAKTIHKEGSAIVIPAAAYQNPRQVKDVHVMTSASKGGGFQIYLPAFSPQGLTIMRGGTFKSDANACCSGVRLMSGGYGKYHDWGFRLAVSGSDDKSCPSPTMTIDLEDKGSTIPLELVYVKPGSFVMGGESTTDDRFRCVEVPKHQVQLSRGFYLGKYPVTQAQYRAVMGGNPSKSTKDPNCPVDNIGVDDATEFCTKLIDTIGKDFRLPTEAEWEYASRAGCSSDFKWFFGNDPSQLADYAWFKDNSGGHSHPVGKKKPNLFGLYDMYGNVLERVSDTYAKDYYAKSPAVDPTGPLQGSKSTFEYKISVSQPGTYSLVAEVVTANEDQFVNVRANDQQSVIVTMPFTCGQWQESPSVKLSLKKGENTLRFWRDKPPQYGIAIQKFRLEPDQPDDDKDWVEVQQDEDEDTEVYILFGQSNMLGMGNVGSKGDIHKDGTLQCAVHQKGLYPYLIDGSKNWVTSSTVRNVRVMQKGHNMGVFKNEFLTVKDKEKIGPEVGIGHILEQQRNGRKVMLIKSCIGNRSLGWDLLPPGSPGYDYKGQTYAGYKESPDHWPSGGPKPKPINWYAGKQYDDDTTNVKTVLKDLSKYYPCASKYQIKGFFWWQGDKDRYSEAHASHYEANLRRLIQQLRADFDAPDAKFVLATMGQNEKDNVKGNDKPIFNAMMAVDGSAGKYPDFVGNVATVYTFPLSKGGASNGHYNGNAETYMNVGEAMGKAMAELVHSG